MEQLRKTLLKEGISFTTYTKWSTYFRAKWREHFASHLTEKEQAAIHMLPNTKYGHYLWHLFSYEKREALEREDSIHAFHTKDKGKCIIFDQYSDEVLFVENASHIRAEHFPRNDDIYIVDEQFTWSFNVTHEADIGPFFIENKL